jgi:hypothetical protein
MNDNKEPEPFPLETEDLSRLRTAMTRRMFEGWQNLARTSIITRQEDLELTLEMQDAAELLYDQLTAMLCRRFVEMETAKSNWRPPTGADGDRKEEIHFARYGW